MKATPSPAWQALQDHRENLDGVKISDLFLDNTSRFSDFSCRAAGLFLDYSKHRVTNETLELLVNLAEERQLTERIKQLFAGELVNNTEQRQALHTALRASNSNQLEVATTLEKMSAFVSSVHGGEFLGSSGDKITDIVNIGIGGSDLGPFMVCEALKPFQIDGVHSHFVSNVDASDICETLRLLNPATTLFVVASKTFTTTETLTNAATARAWLLEWSGDDSATENHFVAVSANVENAIQFGIAEANIFPMWDWVGGRYSLWSAIGLTIALTLGMDNFKALLAGAEDMDQHFVNAPFTENLPVIMAMLGVWYINFWDADTHVVLPYDHYLRFFPKYLQQLDMESNGKRVSRDGDSLTQETGPILWGDAGTNGQHSFHQLLHQGTRLVPADFIATLTSHNPVGNHHDLLFANCLAQSRALMTGKSQALAEQEFQAMGYSEGEAKALAPHKVMPGNRPSSTLVIEQLTPKSLGALIALYEHKVYVQSVIWDINAFDQWGVELGKKLSNEIYDVVCGEGNRENMDASSLGLIDQYVANKNS